MDTIGLKYVVSATEKSKVHLYIDVAEGDQKQQSCMKQHDTRLFRCAVIFQKQAVFNIVMTLRLDFKLDVRSKILKKILFELFSELMCSKLQKYTTNKKSFILLTGLLFQLILTSLIIQRHKTRRNLAYSKLVKASF